MKQTLFGNGVTIGTASRTTQLFSSIEWQGGNGWLVIPGFNTLSGSPELLITASFAVAGGGSPVPDIPNPIAAAGVFPFYAPKGVFINAELVAQSGDEVSFDEIYLMGDA